MRNSCKLLICFLFFWIIQENTAQTTDSINRKQITIEKISQAPKIDGVLDDVAWENAAIATDFVEREPVNGRKIPDSLATHVKIIYDDLGIYFGAVMKDPEPHKILKELTERDQIGNDDFFFILLNGYNDRQQSLQFIVTAAGVQYDAKMTYSNGEDPSWNSVWYSAVKINDDNWVAEIFIPYSELRFSDKEPQVWGLNMEREFRRERTRYSWSPVDNSKGYYSIYDGEVYGINNIKTPTRLSFQPYISTYVNNFDGKSEVIFNGGMDLKYGINDAFTLDMVLVPDFGQAKFDNSILNLSAFEVEFTEQRSFFNEGTELFNKGNLFYSRRIGGFPPVRIELNENEEITKFPHSVDLINALKVSGRTSGGLGLGVFNAITEDTYATVRNTETDEESEIMVAPLTNYNILVLDQRFGDNSSVSFINTNTLRQGHFRDANASGVYLNLINKSNTYRLTTDLEGSWVLQDGATKFGAEGSAGISKISGAHRYTASTFFRTKDYDINDMGISNSINYINYYGYYGYRYLQPKGKLNNLYLNFNLNYNRRLEPDLYNSFNFNFNSSFTTKKYFTFGGGFETTPFGTNDIYEARTFGRHVKVPAYYNFWSWISTDYRKKLALDITVDWYKYDQHGRDNLYLYFSTRYRFSDKWKIYYSHNVELMSNEEGFVNRIDDQILFGRRDRTTFISSLESQYIFNNTMSLNFAFRHYFSQVDYLGYLTLQPDGSLQSNKEYNYTHDATYNSWNIDLRYSWWFAPGSQLTLLYRNAIENYLNSKTHTISRNFEQLFDEPLLHSVSLRITYFLDYNRAKHWFTSDKNENREGIGFYQNYKGRKSGNADIY